MTLEADSIIARRRLTRSLAVWRVLAIVALAVAVGALLLAESTGVGGLGKRANHIARVKVAGLITGDDQMLELVDDIAKASQVKAVIVRIDSPGGTTAGAEMLYRALRRLGEVKPVVAVMDTVAASGGYITALAGDHIVARGNTITGSIGVLFQWAHVQQLLDSLGIKVEEIKSGELKGEPSLFTPPSEEARAATAALVQDSFRWFKELVVERRKLPAAQVDRLADGRVFTGRQAVVEKLVDEIGGEGEAINWLATERGVDKDLKILDWEPKGSLDPSGLGLAMVGRLLRAMGLGEASWIAEKVFAPERLRLDGLVSVWHPES